MNKAFDRVEWDFLDYILRDIGFPEAFSNLIMKCMKTVLFSILINGNSTDFFQPTRGLR